jgi:hypothetical protein
MLMGWSAPLCPGELLGLWQALTTRQAKTDLLNGRAVSGEPNGSPVDV